MYLQTTAGIIFIPYILLIIIDLSQFPAIIKRVLVWLTTAHSWPIFIFVSYSYYSSLRTHSLATKAPVLVPPT